VPRPRLHDENLRTLLLQETGRTISSRGVNALSMRTLAADVGTSTTAVYSLFGGKPGLLAALFEESFAGFGAAQRAVPVTGDVLADFAALARAYWEWARDHPDLYGVMFSQVLGEFERTREQAAAAEATIEPLSALVESAIRAGILTGDAAIITFAIWAGVHGVVSLVLAGCAPHDEAHRSSLFQATADAAVRGWLARPLG